MDLSELPLEILEEVAAYLSPQDLSACSAVSVAWRQAFNLDLFWRPHVFSRLLSYLQRERCLVEPHFCEPSTVDSLQRPCDRRIHVMRKSHLLRNWNKGRYHTHVIKLQTPVVNCNLGIDSLGNHWLAVNLGDRTEVWNVQTTPHFHGTVGNLTGAPSFLEIVGDKLIVVDFHFFVQIFHLNLPTLGFSPSSKFFYNDSDSIYVDLADNEECNSVRNRLRSCFRKNHSVFVLDNLLIGYCGYVEGPKEQFLHVWNIKTETKVSQETVSKALQYKIRISSCSAYVSFDFKAKELLCSFYLFDKYISKLVIYSLKSRSFTNFNITVLGKVEWCDIAKGLVATSHLLHQLHIYNAYDGNLVHILDTNARLVFGPESGLQYQMMGSYMIQPSRESVRVVNVEQHWDNLMLYFYSVYKVIAIPPKFVAVSARPYVSSSKIVMEVWNIHEKVRMFDYVIVDADCPAYHTVQPLLTKTTVAVSKTVKILSFW